jgi:transcriptional regulator with XRE-family HTH domain
MATKPLKMPKLFITNGAEAAALRKKLRINQADFWSRVQVTQSGGSRYEHGRTIPKAMLYLLHFAFAPEKRALELLTYLRNIEINTAKRIFSSK